MLQPKDINDLQNFAVPNQVDFIAASFVQSAADVHFIRGVLGPEGKSIKIISKIENQEVRSDTPYHLNLWRASGLLGKSCNPARQLHLIHLSGAGQV